MKIFYSPSYCGQCYVDLGEKNISFESQILETQGLLTQLALHAGIHQEIPSFHIRLTNYFIAISQYDAQKPGNIFHKSFLIDGMSVAKSLMHWRDNLTLAGWNGNVTIDNCTRLNTLAEIENLYHDDGLAALLNNLSEHIQSMAEGTENTPKTFKELEIVIPCSKNLLPDYLKPLFCNLEKIGTTITEAPADEKQLPEKMNLIEFSQQWKSEAWLSQQDTTSYQVWINSNNKRLDNWLHMTGQPVAGSLMLQSNPQITQMFLLAVQLFRRPLDVNNLLQYLSLPETPLHWKLATKLSHAIQGEGGFYNEKVLETIKNFIERENRADDDDSEPEMTQDQREENYRKYLPFDLCDKASALSLVEETEDVTVKDLTKFLNQLKSYVSHKAAEIGSVAPNDTRVAQLQTVASLIDALLLLMSTFNGETIKFSTLQQWAQSLYETMDFTQYNAQVGSRFVIDSPAKMASKVENVIWCDFYGDINARLSTDFLSPFEQKHLIEKGIMLWDSEHEAEFNHIMLSCPIHMATRRLTLISCKQQGATLLPIHPLKLQLPTDKFTVIDGDGLYEQLPNKDIEHIDNHNVDDETYVTFNAKTHPVTFRDTESYSAMEKLLQNPFDYFMSYQLKFYPLSNNRFAVEGNVAHETIEDLFTANRGKQSLKDYVMGNYDQAFKKALVKKGALLLLPENHFGKNRLEYQLKNCVANLAEIVEANHLTVIACEQKEEQDLGFQNQVQIQGYIDMLLHDANGNDVVFDLKWTSKKDKHLNLLKKNRATQLAIYQAMLLKHNGNTSPARTAFFVMPKGVLVTTDDFEDVHLEKVDIAKVDIMEQLRNGYAKRVAEISEGKIETADNVEITKLDYCNTENVFPLEFEGKRPSKKTENKYSDYKCFTI